MKERGVGGPRDRNRDTISLQFKHLLLSIYSPRPNLNEPLNHAKSIFPSFPLTDTLPIPPARPTPRTHPLLHSPTAITNPLHHETLLLNPLSHSQPGQGGWSWGGHGGRQHGQ